MSIVITAVVLALGYAGLVLGVQRAVMYPAPSAPPVADLDGRADIERLGLGPAGEREAWLLRPAAPAQNPSPALLFAHANAELIDYWADGFQPVRAAGFAVMLVEYPGYGRTPGRPTEASLTAAMLDAYDHLAAREDIDADRIIVHGRSLGGGPACATAVRRPVAGLVLESTFTSARALALRSGVLPFLVLDPWDNLACLSGYEGPLLVLHGEQDDLIPVSHGRQLAAAVPGSSFVPLPCGHNDCARPWTVLLDFLEEGSDAGIPR